MNVESVGEHQRLPGAQMRLDRSLVNALLLLIGNENHDHVGSLNRLLNRGYRKSLFLRASRGRAARIGCNLDVDAAVAHVQRVRVPLAAVADNCDALGLDQAGVAVLFIIDVGHEISLSVTSTEMTSICL